MAVRHKVGEVNYLLSDHLGSTAVTTNSAGAYVTELRYYPYGGTRYNPGSQVTTFRFTGQRWDSGTSLYFYNARWYDPVIGRFLVADTIVPEPGNPQSLNRYAYTLNNPLRYTDPTGHRECEDADCTKQVQPIIRRRHPASPPQSGMSGWTPVPLPDITTYYTPTYDAALYGANPNAWDANSEAYQNAKTQGSMFVGEQLWKWNGVNEKFDPIDNSNACRPGGVPVTLGCTQKAKLSDQKINGLPVVYGSAAVAANDPIYHPAYKQGTRRLYIVTTKVVLILTPLDSGGALRGNALDIYMGISRNTEKIPWTITKIRGDLIFAWQEMR